MSITWKIKRYGQLVKEVELFIWGSKDYVEQSVWINEQKMYMLHESKLISHWLDQ